MALRYVANSVSVSTDITSDTDFLGGVDAEARPILGLRIYATGTWNGNTLTMKVIEPDGSTSTAAPDPSSNTLTANGSMQVIDVSSSSGPFDKVVYTCTGGGSPADITIHYNALFGG